MATMTDRQLADAGWAEITKTTDSYPHYVSKGKPASSHFSKAKVYFDQIDLPSGPVIHPFGSAWLSRPRLARSNGAVETVATEKELTDAITEVVGNTTIKLTSGINGSNRELFIGRKADKTLTVTQLPDVTIKNYSQWYITGSYIRFSGLDISGFTNAGLKVTNTGAGQYASYIDIEKCHIHDGPSGMGILSTHGISYLQVWDNHIHDVGEISNQNKDHGMYLSGAYIILGQNLVYNCAAYCIQLYPDAPGCIAAFNTYDDGYKHTWQRGGLIFGSEDFASTHDVLLVGNIGTNAPGAGAINYWKPGNGNKGLDNLGFGNASSDFQSGSYIQYDGCVHGDPKYRNRGARDYHLNQDTAARIIREEQKKWAPAFDKDNIERTEENLAAGCYAVAA